MRNVVSRKKMRDSVRSLVIAVWWRFASCGKVPCRLGTVSDVSKAPGDFETTATTYQPTGRNIWCKDTIKDTQVQWIIRDIVVLTAVCVYHYCHTAGCKKYKLKNTDIYHILGVKPEHGKSCHNNGNVSNNVLAIIKFIVRHSYFTHPCLWEYLKENSAGNR
jgi:hypothetical protein